MTYGKVVCLNIESRLTAEYIDEHVNLTENFLSIDFTSNDLWHIMVRFPRSEGWIHPF